MKRKGIVTILMCILLLLGLMSYLSFALPNVGEAPTLNIQLTPERIERGKYLATHVMACMDCHSDKDWKKFAGPIVPKSLGSGGERFDQSAGAPGIFVAANITPYYLQNWSDGEIFQAITAGVSKDGRALFPVMPYESYGKLDKEDIYDVIAYLRSIPPKETKVMAPKADFPFNLIINTLPKPAMMQTAPSKKNSVLYGGYLVDAAQCRSCHTNNDGVAFAGGRAFKVNGVVVNSANITAEKNSGIGSWTRQQFVEKFKSYENFTDEKDIIYKEFQTVMPWRQYSGMKETDLNAIYDYLQTVKPVDRNVTKLE